MKVTIKRYDRGCGNHTTIVEEPYASALDNIDGLARATNNATYRGVRFGRQRQMNLVMYLNLYSLCGGDTEKMAEINERGQMEIDVPQETLDEILSKSAAIDAEAARLSAMPRIPTYRCAGHSDGCAASVTVQGSYCASCDHDNN